MSNVQTNFETWWSETGHKMGQLCCETQQQFQKRLAQAAYGKGESHYMMRKVIKTAKKLKKSA